MTDVKIVGVIPARARSTRFPNKPLANIAGLPMIIHVARKVEQALGIENTYIATDDDLIKQTCESYGYKAVMTSPACKTGTDRLCEFAGKIEADIYINVQGDEPLVSPDDIWAIANAKKANPNQVVNGMCSLLDTEDPFDINIPKILVSRSNTLIYASRYPVPAVKDRSLGTPVYKKQVCIYGFSKHELQVFQSYNQKAYAEYFEDIEILRFVDAGLPVLMVETKGNTIAVDNPEDIQKVEQMLGYIK